MGNSEVGHLTLGAGEVVRQDAVRISDAITGGEFFDNPALVAAMRQSQKADHVLHLLGLVSDGGVHSQLDHLEAIVRMCGYFGVKPLLHAITDGRDAPPKSALDYLPKIENLVRDHGGAVASITGRYFAMDRDHRWERTERAWRCLMLGKGRRADTVVEAVEQAYAAGETDEFIRPVLLPGYLPIGGYSPLVSFNFRKDRPRQIISALAAPDFSGFDRGDTALARVTCMMPYDRSIGLPYVVEPERPTTTLGRVISTLGLAQFHCGN